MVLAANSVSSAVAEETPPAPAESETRAAVDLRAFVRPRLHERPRRPTRARERGRVREENISDNEVREIRTVMHRYYPGAIVNISAVTTGCPCADGPACDNQVWIVADRGNESHGLMLSRIGGQWMIGPVQEWWMSFEDYQRRFREARQVRDREERGRRYERLTRERMMLDE